jgi:hypothetical protein
MRLRATKYYKHLSGYEAVAMAEGFSSERVTKQKVLAAWQYLVDSGLAWRLQGFFGREAKYLLNEGIIKPAKGSRA